LLRQRHCGGSIGPRQDDSGGPVSGPSGSPLLPYREPPGRPAGVSSESERGPARPCGPPMGAHQVGHRYGAGCGPCLTVERRRGAPWISTGKTPKRGRKGRLRRVNCRPPGRPST
jgi:hypothetical protein